MSRVVVATAFGGPEVLSVVEQPTGSPGAGQVLLEVRAAGVNPADWKGYTGAFGTDPAKLPLRLGFEASGVVAAVGPDAVGPAGPLAVGDAVIASGCAVPTPPPSSSRPRRWCPSPPRSTGPRRPGSCSPARRRCTR